MSSIRRVSHRRCSWLRIRCISCTSIIITIHGVSGLFSSEIEMVYLDRSSTIAFLDVQFDMAKDIATCVIAAIHFFINTAGNSQLNITIDVGIIGTTVDDRDLGIRLTPQDHDEVTVHVGILTGTDHLLQVEVTVIFITLSDINRN